MKNKTVIVACLFFIPLFFSTSVFASNSISLSVSSNSVVLNLLPKTSEGTFAKSDNLNISVSMSGIGGYTLGIKSNTSGANSTKLINSNDNSKYFSSITSAISESDFSNSSNTSYNDKWGYNPSKYHSSDNTSFQPAPDENGDILDSNNANNASGNYTISIGARANTSTAVGQYVGTVVITAVANISCNPNATTIGGAVCMQDMNDNVINSMETDTQYQLIDIRDGKQYYIAKMKDGRVWMTQNLDLDLETTPTNVEPLTHENTDLGWTVLDTNATWTPSTATVTAAADYGSNSNTTPASFDYGETYRYVSTSGATTSFTSKSDCEAAHNDGTCAHYHVGNYYNWSAAVASNDTSSITANYTSAPNSICPAGWRLPTSIESSASNSYSEINYTWVSENLTQNYITNTSSATYKTNGWINIRNNPMYMVAAGYKSGTSAVTGLGSNGFYWSSTTYSNTIAYAPFITSSGLYPAYYYSNTTTRGNGLSIRCVARQTNTGSTTISFNKNANDATGSMNNQTYNAGTLNTLPANGFTRSNYRLNSWNTKPDGTGDSFADVGDYYAKTGTGTTNVTLYAIWDRVYRITFLTNNAAGINFDGTVYTNGQSAEFLPNQSYRIYGEYNTRYAFSNWSITAGSLGNSSYQTTDYTVVGDATITLTGQYVSTAMQNLSSSSCTTTPSPVYDTRDNEVYWISELADGKCWFLDNLRFNPIGATITTSNTNSDGSNMVYTNKDVVSSSSDNYTNAYVNIDHRNEVASKVFGYGSGKKGVFYNYCAATAGTNCVYGNTSTTNNYDLCPAGWRMPTGKNDGEGKTLYSSVNEKSSRFRDSLSDNNMGYISTSGYISGRFHIWTSTTDISGTAFRSAYIISDSFLGNSNDISFGTSDYKYYANAIRCLLK